MKGLVDHPPGPSCFCGSSLRYNTRVNGETHPSRSPVPVTCNMTTSFLPATPLAWSRIFSSTFASSSANCFRLWRRSRIETPGILQLVQIIELREPLALVGSFFRQRIVDVMERGLRRRKLEGSHIVEDG